ncbi:MAG: aminotransferase class I/II-fold pyridoxal phosphate-dependent enzyme [Actinomycetota bacterium]|nr:aminotransferase class I/II-fold pyridoxal phosphate-dependent enzyme [Actinomycetota bacterium]
MMMELTIADFGNARGAREIAQRIDELVEVRRATFGTKLPPIRTLARLLDVSPTTIAAAYLELERRGVAKGQGRGGTVLVRRNPPLGAARVFHMFPEQSSPATHDLSTGFPDPLLLPDLEAALASAALGRGAHNYLNRHVTEELAPVLAKLLEVEPENITVVNGSLDALDRLLGQVCVPGDRVIVEEPGFPPIFDLLDVHRLVPVPVRSDAEGIDPDSLAEALEHRAQVMIFQPRAQNPTGVSTTARRLGELSSLLAQARPVTVIEDDHSGLVSTAPRVTMRGLVPGPVATIYGFSKSHGPDLRISAIAAGEDLLAKVVERRRLGPSWTSGLIQRLLAHLLTEEVPTAQVERAKAVYAERLGLLAGQLRAIGADVASHDGLNCWIPVTSELGVITDLARISVVAAPGSAFYLDGRSEPHIRVTTAAIDGLAPGLIEVIGRWL